MSSKGSQSIGRFALHPGHNVRCFSALTPRDFAPSDLPICPPASEVAAVSVVVEGVPPDIVESLFRLAAEAGVGIGAGADRICVSGSVPRLHRLAELAERLLPGIGAETSAAITAYAHAAAARTPTLVMGIINATPDSFSDGGACADPQAAVERGLELLRAGADVLDVGGESTRPGAGEVESGEELRRVLPVVRGLRARTEAPISIDTRKASVAGPCIDAGANWINDVSGLTFDAAMAGLAAQNPQVTLVLMHSRSRPQDEQFSTEYDADGSPAYVDVVADTLRWLRRQVGVATSAGVDPQRIWIDPGFGFGKTFEQNLELLRRLREYTSAGLPLLVGTSRKSTLGRLLGGAPAAERLEGSAATAAWAVAHGAAAVRVHDVREIKRTVQVIDALR